MSGCTETGKPRIAILMAVYEPRMDWLREQLLSLNTQTYPNLMLYIRDDCSPTVPDEEIQSCGQHCIRAFPYEIRRNEENLGSNGTFERLTQEAEGEYFAYCDQDDVWLPEKLSRLEEAMDENAQMAYCDMEIIDGDGKRIAGSLKEIRPRLHYAQGENLGEAYLFRNCTAGCSMLVRAEAARKAVPFPRQTVCDQWIAIAAALAGTARFVKEPLQGYRQHGNNQTGILTGVDSKASYRQKRIEPLKERLAAYRRLAEPSREMAAFIEAREQKRVRNIWRYRRFSPYEAVFEIAMCFLPDAIVKIFLRRSS